MCWRTGLYSEFAEYFDIRPAPHEPFKVHICTLAHAYGESLEKGELVVESRGGRPRVVHFDNSWPLAAASWGALLEDPDPCFAELIELQNAIAPSDADRVRFRGCLESAEAVLAAAAENGGLSAAIERSREDPSRLDAVLRRQFFALHSWKLAGELTNYRRFFDVSGLVGLKIEKPPVFEAAHARVERMIRDGQLDGLRLDHPDGLRDPLGYFERLRGLLPDGRLYVEKILENDERLPGEWPIDGTVGYEFLAKVNRLWMDDRRIDAFTGDLCRFHRPYREFRGAGAREEARDRRVHFFGRPRPVERHRAQHRARRLADPRLEPAAAARGAGERHHRAGGLSNLSHRR